MPGIFEPSYEFSAADNKAQQFKQHCVYMIATGKWSYGQKLPSIRQGEKIWNINRITIQRVYQWLEETGLVESKDRSGYYVTGIAKQQRLSRHRFELDRIYDEFSEVIKDRTGLSTYAVFRYLAKKAEIETREKPEFAFVECTSLQAAQHSVEISDHFSISIQAMTTHEIDRVAQRIPGHIRTILTTHFHYADLLEIFNETDIALIAVPIEIDLDILADCIIRKPNFLLVETSKSMAEHITQDALYQFNELQFDFEIVSDIETRLIELFAHPDNSDGNLVVLLSPRHWGSVNESWHQNANINQLKFRIKHDAWNEIADALGLPLGDI